MRARIAAIVLVTCGICSPVAADPRVVEETGRLELPVAAPFRQLRIDNPLGDVRIEGHDAATIVIEVRKRAPDDASVDRLHIAVMPNRDVVRILTTIEGAGARDRMRIDLVIRAPRDARAVISADRVEVVDLDAHVIARRPRAP
jgi:hypothetical protein